MRSDYPNSNEPSEDPDDAVARWEAYRALMRKTGDIQMMPWLEDDDADEVEPAPPWTGGHAEHPSFAPVDPVGADAAIEFDARVDPAPAVPPPPPEPRQDALSLSMWPLSARLFGAMATLVAALALAAALMPRHPGPFDLASRAAPSSLQSGLGGLAKLAANDAPGVEPPSGALPVALPLVDANAAAHAALARPASLQQPSDIRRHTASSRSCRHCRREHAARKHHRAERCSIGTAAERRRCHAALASSRPLIEARYRLR